MAQCICGRGFTQIAFTDNPRLDSLCPKCREASTPKGYAADHEWVCGHITEFKTDKYHNES